MSEPFLSTGWLEQLASLGGGLPPVPGVNLVIQHEVSGAPDGKVRYYVCVVDGVIGEVAPGKHAEPDVMMVAKAPDALAVLRGDKSEEVAFMQGRLKIDGAYRQYLIDHRDWRRSAPCHELREAMAGFTTT